MGHLRSGKNKVDATPPSDDSPSAASYFAGGLIAEGKQPVRDWGFATR